MVFLLAAEARSWIYWTNASGLNSFDNDKLNRHSTASYFPGPFEDNQTVANSPQAKKRARQAENRRQRNASQRSAMRTAIKKVISAIDAGEQDVASSAYQAAVPVIDRAVTHGLIHKNKAARHKSRLNVKVKALAG